MINKHKRYFFSILKTFDIVQHNPFFTKVQHNVETA